MKARLHFHDYIDTRNGHVALSCTVSEERRGQNVLFLIALTVR